MATRLPRREFVLRTLGACLVPFAAVRDEWAVASLALQDPPASLVAGARRGLSYLGETSLEAAQTIGRARLRALGVGETAEAIAGPTAATLALIAAAPDEQTAIDALVAAVRRDFAEGRSIEVEGWVLSPTEVDLCMLALVAPAARP
jgi:hypothetical protein